MIDMKKVIKGLDSCAKWMSENDNDACDNCPYHHSLFNYNDNDCIATVNNDAIALLKKQEEQIKTCDESLEKAREEIKWLQGMLKEQEEVEGHWIPIESPTGVEAFGIKEMTVQFVRCSVCDAEEDVSFAAYRFCPRCGANMEGR